MQSILLIVDNTSMLSNGFRWALSKLGHKIIYLSIFDNTVNIDGKSDKLEDTGFISMLKKYNVTIAIFIPSILSAEVELRNDINDRLNQLIRLIFKNGVNRLILLSSVWAKPDEPKGRHHYLWRIEETVRYLDVDIKVFRIPLVYGIEEDIIHSLVNDSITRFLMVVPDSPETALLFIDDLAGIISNSIQSEGPFQRARYIIPPKRIKIQDIVRNSMASSTRKGILLIVNDIFYRLLSKLFDFKKRGIYIRVKKDFFRNIEISWDGFDDGFSYNFKDVIDYIDKVSEVKVK